MVDDDKEMLKILRMFLADDYQVTIVDNGRQAIEYIVKHTPDLILLDYMMPLFDGPHVLEIIRKREASRRVPVIFLTAVSEREQIMQCLQLKPQGFPPEEMIILQHAGSIHTAHVDIGHFLQLFLAFGRYRIAGHNRVSHRIDERRIGFVHHIKNDALTGIFVRT